MSSGYGNLNNQFISQRSPLTFRSEEIQAGVLTKPIKTVQKTIETGVDNFIPEKDEKKKKLRKRAIATGSTVLVLSALTMLFNPRSSGKLMAKLKDIQASLDIKIKNSKNNFFKSGLYNYYKKLLGITEKAGNIYFNVNSGKDVVFQNWCINSNKKYPEIFTKNKTVYKIVKSLDNGFVTVFKKPHEKITKFFDKISRSTVKGKYAKAGKSFNKIEETLKLMMEKLPKEKRALVESKLAEIQKARGAFSDEKLMERFLEQEKLMEGLDRKWLKVFNKSKNNKFKGIDSFWAKDILKNERAQVEKNGEKLVENLVGSKNKKGLYDEVLDIYREHLSKEEMLNLDNKLFKASKKLKKANISECIEYFDKKRDLQIGGAPTDIVTQLFGMGVCGAAVAKAEKKDRLSKLLTTGIPVVVGLGSSLVFSALLYSGGVGIIAGTVVGGITTLACNLINKYVFKNKDDDDEEEKPQKQHASNVKNNPQEVKNV